MSSSIPYPGGLVTSAHHHAASVSGSSSNIPPTHVPGGVNQSFRNTLRLNIPGLTKDLHVRFPDCRLPVCGRCKKNYKTRDMCRTQGEHTDLPWSTVYICITLDHTCTDASGRLRTGKDIRFTAHNMDWMPYCFKSEVGAKTLICAACKTKNYTRKQCRSKSHHRFLPWSTVYVTLSCNSSGSPVLVRPGNKRGNLESSGNSNGDDSIEFSNKRRAVGDGDHPEVKKVVSSGENNSSDNDNATKPKKTNQVELDEEKSDDITQVDVSRTFLVQVSVGTYVLKWLDFDRTKANPVHPYLQDSMGMGMGCSMGMGSSMHLAAAQHRSHAVHQSQFYGAHGYGPNNDMGIGGYPDTRSPYGPPGHYMPAYFGWGGGGGSLYGPRDGVAPDAAEQHSAPHHGNMPHPYWNSAAPHDPYGNGGVGSVSADRWAGYQGGGNHYRDPSNARGMYGNGYSGASPLNSQTPSETSQDGDYGNSTRRRNEITIGI